MATARLGRLLITFVLCAGGALQEPILYLSLYFKTHRAAYYELLDRVRIKGDWEAWLDFFLRGVRETSEQAADAARRIIVLFDKHKLQIKGLKRAAASVLHVYEALQHTPITSISVTASTLGISAPTVAKAIQHLRHLGIVNEITGKERRRLFVYQEYLAILNEGTEPFR